MSNTFYDWSQVVNAWRQQYTKLGPEAKKRFEDCIHPNHLFARGSPVCGIPLYIGIHADQGTTRIIIPKPILDRLCTLLNQLLTQLPPLQITVAPGRYTNTEICTIDTPAQYKELLDREKKASKAAKRAERLRQAKEEWKHARDLVKQNKYVFCSIDIEAYELDHSIILEIGWSLYDSRTDRFMDQHYLNSSYRHLQNGKFVEDQKLRFMFGTSVWCPLSTAFEELRKDLDWAVERDGGFVLVGHGLDSDLKYLQKQKFKWPGDTTDVTKSPVVSIFNTDVMYGASIGDLHNPPSLGGTLSALQVETWCLHNAGNDAHYTMLLFQELVNQGSAF